MGRCRVRLKGMENKNNGEENFSKRRSGLLIKKAHEISLLSGAEVALIVFSTKGKLLEYSTDSCMGRILERYNRYSYAERQLHGNETEPIGNEMLKAMLEVLQRNQKHFMGEDLENLSLKELRNIEQQVRSSLNLVRSKKNQLMLQFSAELQKKNQLLQEQNNLLAIKRQRAQWEQEQQQQMHDSNSSNVLMPPLSNNSYQMAEGNGEDEYTSPGN